MDGLARARGFIGDGFGDGQQRMIYGVTKGRGGGIGNVAEVMTIKKAPVVVEHGEGHWCKFSRTVGAGALAAGLT